jgi:diguanylate cyclase (GGDEF)-like protein
MRGARRQQRPVSPGSVAPGPPPGGADLRRDPLGSPGRLAAASSVAALLLVVLPAGVGAGARVPWLGGAVLLVAAGAAVIRTAVTRRVAVTTGGPARSRLVAGLLLVGTGAVLVGSAGLGPDLGDGGGAPRGTVASVALAALALGALALPSTRARSPLVPIDAATVVLALLALLWVAPGGAHTMAVPGPAPVPPAAVAALLAAAVALVRLDPDRDHALRPVVAAVALVALATTTPALVGTGGERRPAVFVAALWWVAAPVVLAAAGVRSRPLPVPDLDQRFRRHRRVARLHEVLPGTALVVALVAVAVHQAVLGRVDLVAMGLAALAVVLATTRVAILQREQRRVLRALEATAAEAAAQARRDQLTGLGNRAALEEHLAAALRTPSREGVSVFIVDLDDFKAVNDLDGHETGDRLLRAVTPVLTEAFGPASFRIGGDEFVGVRDDLDERAADSVAAAIVAALSEPILLDGRRVQIGASVGVARSAPRRTAGRGRPDTPDALLRRADLALYRAKELGRRCWATYDAGLQALADRRLALQQGLLRAVDRGGVEVHFEPVVRLDDRHPVVAAARFSWPDPEHGLLPHAEVLRVADDAGRHTQLLELALAEVEDRLGGAASPDPPVGLALGLDGRDLAGGDPARRLSLAMRRAGAAGVPLVIEVPESVVADERLSEPLEDLVRAGARLLVTGFGNGPSSLRRLARYPAPAIRIDPSFTAGLGVRRDDRVILDAVAGLAADLGIELHAEGVTSTEQADLLAGLGVSAASGPVFGRPVPWPEFERRHLGGRPVSRPPGSRP